MLERADKTAQLIGLTDKAASRLKVIAAMDRATVTRFEAKAYKVYDKHPTLDAREKLYKTLLNDFMTHDIDWSKEVFAFLWKDIDKAVRNTDKGWLEAYEIARANQKKQTQLLSQRPAKAPEPLVDMGAPAEGGD